ncbi:MAG: cadherin-like beta sandwich domain-containing protein [Clostridia bacterium]
MKKIKIIISVLLFFAVILILNNKVDATAISVSPSNPKRGQTVTITVSVPNVNTVDLTATISGAGTSSTIRLVDGSMTGEAKTFSKTVSVTPTTTGTISVVVSSGSNAVLNGQYVNVSASKNITVTEPSNSSSGGSTSSGTTTKKTTTNNNTTTQPPEEKKSTDSTLGSLSIAEGAITPEFNKDVKEYAITVPNEVTKLNITATPTDSKATVSVTEYEELKEGENAITITVTAEDGTTKSDYVLKVTRQRKELALEKLVIKYTNQNGEVVEVPLTPEFVSSTYEYSIENLEYWVKTLNIEALANIEGATVEIIGADSLEEGENVITITVKNIITVEATEDGTEPTEQEETKTYTIKFNKNAEPTIIGKISNWFKGVFGGISAWYANNQEKAIFGALMLCIVALIGLSIYIIVDYKKYQELLNKIGKLNILNNNEIKTSVATEKATNIEEKTNNIEDIYKNRKDEIETNTEKAENNQNKEDKPKGGRHF